MNNLESLREFAERLKDEQAEKRRQSRPEPPGGAVSSVKDMLAEFDLLAFIQADTGENGRQSADRVDFDACPVCGHNNCFTYYPSTSSWHCFGASNATGYEGGTALEYYKATRGADDVQAVKWLRDQTGHPYERERAGIAGKPVAVEVVESPGLMDNPYIERLKNGAVRKPSVPAIVWWLEQPVLGLSHVRYNVLDGVIEAELLPWDERPHTWTDADLSNLLAELQRLTGGYPESDTSLRHAVVVLSQKRKYNPLLDVLDGLPAWDGVPRADTLLIDFLGAEDTEYNRAVTRLTLDGAIMRAYRPGCKFDYCTVLSSKRQGIGKSTLIRKLALSDRFFTDCLGNIATKEACENIQGRWFVEVSELESLRKREVETIKQFLSRQEDRYRASYGRNSETRPRTCVFVGTTNSTAFLSDRSGNRRFLPVECGMIRPRLDVFAKDAESHISQAWAEVLTAYRENERLPLLLPDAVRDAAESQREAYSLDDPKEGLISGWINDKCKPGELVCTTQIMELVFGIGREEWCQPRNKALTNEIVQILDRMPELERAGKRRITHSREYGRAKCWKYKGGGEVAHP